MGFWEVLSAIDNRGAARVDKVCKHAMDDRPTKRPVRAILVVRGDLRTASWSEIPN